MGLTASKDDRVHENNAASKSISIEKAATPCTQSDAAVPEQTFAYKITLEIETSSHDGYCTENNKCEYRSKIKTCNITNEQLESLLGEYSLADIMGDPDLLEMDTLEPLVRDELAPRSWGTVRYECQFDEESRKHDLMTHDYNITCKKIEPLMGGAH